LLSIETTPYRPNTTELLDPSAAEFRRQPEACRDAAAGKKFGAPPGQPKFMDAAAAVFSALVKNRVGVNL